MTKRLFVAVPVSKEVQERIKAIYQPLKNTGADLKFVPLENLHFTVKFLGDVEESKITELVEKIKTFVSNRNRFSVDLKGVGAFLNNNSIKVIWVGADNPNLISLIKDLDKELDCLKKNEQEEIPHLTIARVKSEKNKEKLADFIKKFATENFGSIVVEKLILYESKLTREGPNYTLLGEWDLK
ncbi:MAG: RNA 2',3'-cyclic phosphodiesterase [Nanoarchaeota archaeon]